MTAPPAPRAPTAATARSGTPILGPVAHPLPLTGERTLPGVPGEEYWFARHEAVYRWIVGTMADRLRDAVVVEAGSGEGYGADLLRNAGARVVVSLEYDEAAVRHARSTYSAVGTTRANLAAMPLAAGSADVLVSLQVVEHLWDLPGFLRDCRTVLRAGGLAVMSTPNRPVFSPGLGRGEKPTNPFHVEELDAEQLHDLLATAGFTDVVVHGLHHGRRIRDWERENGVGIVAAQIAASLGAGDAPSTLAECVASVTVHDFVLGDSDDAQDLVAVAVAP
jgi:SAM-dependent methyltransferase